MNKLQRKLLAEGEKLKGVVVNKEITLFQAGTYKKPVGYDKFPPLTDKEWKDLYGRRRS